MFFFSMSLLKIYVPTNSQDSAPSNELGHCDVKAVNCVGLGLILRRDYARGTAAFSLTV